MAVLSQPDNHDCFFLFPELTLGQIECKEGGAGGYTKIDDPRRSIESIFKHGQSAICDRAFAWGWYRFDSYTGGKMPEQKVDQMRCGTVHPIWMRGTHPTVKEGTVNRTACINFYDMLNGCLSSLNIRVRNCNGFQGHPTRNFDEISVRESLPILRLSDNALPKSY